MKRAFLLICILCASFALYSIHKKPAKSGIPDGTYYIENMLIDQEMKQVKLLTSEIIFTKKTGRLSVFVGCNRISGKFSTGKSNQFKAGEMISTKMACPDMKENEFLQLLTKATKYKIKGEIIEIFEKNNLLIVLKKKKKDSPVEENTTYEGHYKLESMLMNGKLKTDNYSKSSVTIKKGHIQCSVGCNSISGEFITQGDKIIPLKLMMTEMYCESVARIEELFVNHLNMVDSYGLENGKLNFYLKGELVIVLRRV